MASGKFAGGVGSDNNPYLVEDAADLNAIRKKPAAAYKLVMNINLGVYPYNIGKGWLPIRNFTGSINGNGKTIMNLFINRPAEDHIGFIESASQDDNVNFQISDIAFTNSDIKGHDYVGTICGSFDQTQTVGKPHCLFERIHVDGKIEGNDYIGGCIGEIKHTGTVEKQTLCRNIFSDVDISATALNKNFGSIFGHLDSSVFSMDHVISASSFSNIIKGSIQSSFSPESYGVIDGKVEMTSCYYDKVHWPGNGTTGTTGVDSAALKVKTLSDFDKLSLDGKAIWSYQEGQRYPMLLEFLPNRVFAKLKDGYYIYADDAWKKISNEKPTAREAELYGMKNASLIDFHAWDKLRKLSSLAELCNIVPVSRGTEQTTATFSMKQETEKTSENKNYFSKTISFDDFGQAIVSIEKGVEK